MNDDQSSLQILMAAGATAILGVWLSYLVRLRIFIAILTSLGINLAVGIGLALLDADRQQLPDLNQHMRGPNAGPLVVSLFVAANLGVGLAVKLYRAAVLEKVTDTERLTGLPAARAWLSPVNVTSVICLAVTTNFVFGWNYIGITILGIGMLLAYPIMNTLSKESRIEAAPPQAPADERQRVLALVEAGKISAEDGAELLTALAQSQAAEAGASGAIGGPRRLMVAGAAVVLVGFFLPWFTINVTQAMHDAVGSAQQNMQQMMPQFSGVINQSMPNNDMVQMPVANAMQATIHGGDVRNGLGWIVLAVVATPAGLPFFWMPRGENRLLLRNCTVGALVVGTALVLYLLSDGLNSVTSIEPGFMLAIGGYVIVWVGTAREYFPRRGARGVVMPAVG